MFREVSVIEAREVLRLWLRRYSLREIARMASIDRKTARRYVQAAVDAGLAPGSAEDALDDLLLGAVAGEIRTGRPAGRGESWARLETERAFLTERLGERLHLTKIHELLRRRGVLVPYRTLHRFCVAELEFGRQRATVRVVDGKPGEEVQVDFGRMGLVFDPKTQRRRVAQGLIFTAVFSRHLFCWLSFEQTTAAVIEGCEEAWSYFGGIFKVVIIDNLKPVVNTADPLSPHLNIASWSTRRRAASWWTPLACGRRRISRGSSDKSRIAGTPGSRARRSSASPRRARG
jgi:transposase